MSGRILVSGAQVGVFHHPHAAPEKHDHLVLDLDGGARVTLNDARRFGAVDLWPTADARGATACSPASAPSRSATPSTPAISPRGWPGGVTPVKAVLLDQRVVAGPRQHLRLRGAVARPRLAAAARARRDRRPRPRRSSPRSAPCSLDAHRRRRLVLARLPPGRRRARLLPALVRGLWPRGRALPPLRRPGRAGRPGGPVELLLPGLPALTICGNVRPAAGIQ